MQPKLKHVRRRTKLNAEAQICNAWWRMQPKLKHVRRRTKLNAEAQIYNAWWRMQPVSVGGGAGVGRREAGGASGADTQVLVLSLLALLVQKYKY
jgi:hypothetical protein